ncbi:hypothetical protein D9M70_548810 [compost metagenome]
MALSTKPMLVTRTWPFNSAVRRKSVASDRDASSEIVRNRSTTGASTGVGVSRPSMRSKSAAPTRRSSAASLRDTVVWSTPSERAAWLSVAPRTR